MEKIFKGYGIKMDYSNDLDNSDISNNSDDLDNSDSSENYVNKEIFYTFLEKSKILLEKWQQFCQKEHIVENELFAQDLFDIYTEKFNYEPRGMVQCLIILRDVLKEEEGLNFTIADILNLNDPTNSKGSTIMIMKQEDNVHNLTKDEIKNIINKYIREETYLQEFITYGTYTAIEEI